MTFIWDSLSWAKSCQNIVAYEQIMQDLFLAYEVSSLHQHR